MSYISEGHFSFSKNTKFYSESLQLLQEDNKNFSKHPRKATETFQ